MTQIRNTGWLAALVGIVSGIVSAAVLEPIGANLDGAFLGLASDALTISLPLAISAGGVFGLLGGLFLALVFNAKLTEIAAFGFASVAGMLVASEAAIWIFLELEGSGRAEFVWPYVAGSLIGGTVLLVPTTWIGKLKLGPLLRNGVTWPTIWAVSVAMLMVQLGRDDALSFLWTAPLFAGWQALVLAAVAGAIQRRSDYSQV